MCSTVNKLLFIISQKYTNCYSHSKHSWTKFCSPMSQLLSTGSQKCTNYYSQRGFLNKNLLTTVSIVVHCLTHLHQWLFTQQVHLPEGRWEEVFTMWHHQNAALTCLVPTDPSALFSACRRLDSPDCKRINTIGNFCNKWVGLLESGGGMGVGGRLGVYRVWMF